MTQIKFRDLSLTLKTAAIGGLMYVVMFVITFLSVLFE